MPRTVSMLAALAALAVAGLLAPPADAATLTYPAVLSSGKTYPSAWAATITVEPHYFDNGQAKFWSRAFCSAGPVCGGVGPTIEVVAGDNFTLTVTNNLGANPAGEDTTRNSMHSPNTTNLHTHGLHIDPIVDTVFIRADPGESLVYLYTVWRCRLTPGSPRVDPGLIALGVSACGYNMMSRSQTLLSTSACAATTRCR